MSLLAEIWHDRGEIDRARDLLVDCLRNLVKEVQESEFESNRQTCTQTFEHHRATYLRLFSDGENELAKQGIPREPI